MEGGGGARDTAAEEQEGESFWLGTKGTGAEKASVHTLRLTGKH